MNCIIWVTNNTFKFSKINSKGCTLSKNTWQNITLNTEENTQVLFFVNKYCTEIKHLKEEYISII